MIKRIKTKRMKPKRMRAKAEGFFERAEKRFPEALSGRESEIRRVARKLYGSEADAESMLRPLRIRNIKRYLGVAAVTVMLTAVGISTYMADGRELIDGAPGQEIAVSRPESGAKSIALRLEVEGDEAEWSGDVTISVKPEESGDESIEEKEEETPLQALGKRASRLVKTLNKDRSGDELILPGRLDDGSVLRWSEKRSSGFAAFPFIGAIALLAVFLGRYDELKKLEREAESSVKYELPNFIGKLTLLLNAGLVLSEAFSRICGSYEESIRSGGERKYFYDELLEIRKSMEETNSPMIIAFRNFATRSGVRELMRLSNILSDNINKGSGLSEKLQAESELMLMARKKNAEERGKLAETKMTFPMALMLLSLVLVTAAPALISM